MVQKSKKAIPNEIDIMDGVVKRLFSYIRPYRTRFIWSVIFGFLAAALYGILMFLLDSVFSVILDRSATSFQPFKKVPIDWLKDLEYAIPTGAGRIKAVVFICFSVPALYATQGFMTYFHRYLILWINTKVLYKLRDESFSSIIRQSLGFFNEAKQGELMHSVATQTKVSADAGMAALSAWIQHPVKIVAILLVCLKMDPLYTLGALVVFPLCILPVVLIARKVRKAGNREEIEAEGLMVTMQESFDGIRLVKAHAREEYQRDRFNQNSHRLLAWLMRWKKAMEFSTPMVEIVAAVGISLGLVYSYVREMNPETFLVLNLAMISMYAPAKALSRLHLQLQRCKVSASRVFGYIDRQPDVEDLPDAVALESVEGPFQLENINFSYEPGTPVIKDLSLTFEPGKKYALVGQSGSGKSTVLSLMMRFYDPDSGVIKLSGRDIKDYTQASLRDQIGFVSQDVFHFHDTIWANIQYGKLDATDAEIENAAKMAHADEFIKVLPDGYQTMLGDKGRTISGGQQQRLSIARAILRNAPILFLDEAMSALDTESEKKVQDAIETLSQGKTVVAIAHRLSTILDSDEIIVMKNGRVEDKGPHAELVLSCPEYKRLYELQFKIEPDS